MEVIVIQLSQISWQAINYKNMNFEVKFNLFTLRFIFKLVFKYHDYFKTHVIWWYTHVYASFEVVNNTCNFAICTLGFSDCISVSSLRLSFQVYHQLWYTRLWTADRVFTVWCNLFIQIPLTLGFKSWLQNFHWEVVGLMFNNFS